MVGYSYIDLQKASWETNPEVAFEQFADSTLPIMAINGFRYSASPHNFPVLGSTTVCCFSEKAKVR
jgi:hypothetical protein